MFENLKAITANIRGINACGKRQILSAKWEKEGIDAALLSEVQKNTGGMEKEGNWGKYKVFYSTGVDPKKREEQEQKRENKATEIIKNTQEKKGKIEPAPICKPKPKQKPTGDTNTHKTGKGYNNASKKNSDYEHAGVAIAIHRKWVNLVEEVREISGRNMTVILNTGSGKLALTATYGPTAESKENTKNIYWEELAQEMETNKNCIRIVAGDFNARIYEVQQDEKAFIGANIINRTGYLTKGIAENTKDNRSRFVEFLKTQEMAAINTIIDKPPQKCVTYKEKVPQHNPEKEEYQGENTGPFDHTK